MQQLRSSLVGLLVLGTSGILTLGCGDDPTTSQKEPESSTAAPLVENCAGSPAFDPVAFCRNLSGFTAIIGTSNDDVLTGTAGPDCIVGLGAQDVINGLGGNDIIFAGDGDDVIRGGGGNDQISGGSGQDQLFGEAGDDLL